MCELLYKVGLQSTSSHGSGVHFFFSVQATKCGATSVEPKSRSFCEPNSFVFRNHFSSLEDKTTKNPTSFWKKLTNFPKNSYRFMVNLMTGKFVWKSWKINWKLLVLFILLQKLQSVSWNSPPGFRYRALKQHKKIAKEFTRLSHCMKHKVPKRQKLLFVVTPVHFSLNIYRLEFTHQKLNPMYFNFQKTIRWFIYHLLICTWTLTIQKYEKCKKRKIFPNHFLHNCQTVDCISSVEISDWQLFVCILSFDNNYVSLVVHIGILTHH